MDINWQSVQLVTESKYPYVGPLSLCIIEYVQKVYLTRESGDIDNIKYLQIWQFGLPFIKTFFFTSIHQIFSKIKLNLHLLSSTLFCLQMVTMSLYCCIKHFFFTSMVYLILHPSKLYIHCDLTDRESTGKTFMCGDVCGGLGVVVHEEIICL